MKIFIVIPAFNEEKRLGRLLKELADQKLQAVVVDDGSLDDTFKIASKYCKFVLHHKANLGKGEALKTGCDFAFNNGAGGVILMDADGQHLSKDIENFSKALNSKKYDIVYGTRTFKGDVPLERFLANKLASVEVNILFGTYISDILCGFRAFTKEAYQKIKWTTAGYSVEAEMVIKAIIRKLRFCEVEVSTVYFDKYKGVSLTEFFEICFNILYWKFKINL